MHGSFLAGFGTGFSFYANRPIQVPFHIEYGGRLSVTFPHRLYLGTLALSSSSIARSDYVLAAELGYEMQRLNWLSGRFYAAFGGAYLLQQRQ